MISEFKADPPPSKTTASVTSRGEKTPLRTRRSGSPFRCISNLVQQMSCENDQELSIARTRIQELESLAANRQKEVLYYVLFLASYESYALMSQENQLHSSLSYLLPFLSSQLWST